MTVNENDADTMAIVGRMIAIFLGDYETAIDLAGRSLKFNKNSSLGWRSARLDLHLLQRAHRSH
jgi:hypothetical protein